MTIAVCTMACDRKIDSIYSWESLMSLEGSYSIYINYEGTNLSPILNRIDHMKSINPEIDISLDIWTWRTENSTKKWRNLPRFDQDQSRLLPIVVSRNMCREFAIATWSSHLLFVDSDIQPPIDMIPRLLETGKDAVGGLVYGRGVHSHAMYIGQPMEEIIQGDPPYTLVKAEHGNIGFCMLSRKLFSRIAFRWGMSDYPDGSSRITSDDPAFHLDAFKMFGDWMYIRKDVVGKHCGDLQNDHVAEF